MRKWFVIFLLILLPLRGLAGDVMAYSMLPNTINSIANNSISASENLVFNKQSAAQATPAMPCHTESAANDENDAPQNQCTTCQACHLTVALSLQLPNALLHNTSAAPEQRAAQWSSAETRLLAKPPVF